MVMFLRVGRSYFGMKNEFRHVESWCFVPLISILAPKIMEE
jgi:hypothetical protein